MTLTANSNRKIEASLRSHRTFNPIRNIVDNLKPPSHHPKPLLNLALGDPTAYGNLNCPTVLADCIQESLVKGNANGYLPSSGCLNAKKAIAQYTSREGFQPVVDDDVIIASGCSGAVELTITVLINEGDNILVPRPGFPLYEVITKSLGGDVKHYNLIANDNWNCDVNHMESLIDEKTKAILVNNPSNPCGTNYSKEHLLQIVALARKYGLPIIADEIYGGCVFDGEFVPLFTVSDDVPILSLGGLAKQFIVPGWRVGWITIHDKNDKLNDIRNGLKSLTQIILGANSLVQAAIPRVLTPIAGSNDEKSLGQFHTRYMSILQTNACLCEELAMDCAEVSVSIPQGAMYAMIGIKMDEMSDIIDDTDFAQKLLQEENLVLLPGQCFGMKGFIRIVTCPPNEIIREAFNRIKLFIARHKKTESIVIENVNVKKQKLC